MTHLRWREFQSWESGDSRLERNPLAVKWLNPASRFAVGYRLRGLTCPLLTPLSGAASAAAFSASAAAAA